MANIAVASGTVTRPADITAYASGDLVANSTTAGSVVPITLANLCNGPGQSAQIRRLRIRTSSTNITTATFRVHLFSSATITAANGDNAAFSVSGSANYLGQADVTLTQAFTDGAFGTVTTEINTYGAQNVYALLEARSAYTPTSAGTITVSLEATL